MLFRLVRSPSLLLLREAFTSLLPVILVMNVLVLLSGATQFLSLLGLSDTAGLAGLELSRLYFFLIPLFLNLALSVLLAKENELEPIGAVLLTIVCLCRGTGYLSIDSASELISFHSSIFATVPCTFATIYILKYFSCWPKLKLLPYRSELSPRLQKNLNLLIPGLLTVLVFEIARAMVLGISSAGILQALLEQVPPVKNLGAIPELILFKLLSGTSWFFGLHGELSIDGFFRLINHTPSGVANSIQLKAFHDVFMNIGGSGATFVVPFVLLWNTRSRSLRTLAKLSLPFVFFNVNEILLFGLPIILNPAYFIPFIVAPFMNMGIALFMMNMGAFSMVTATVNWMSPPFYNAYIASGGAWGAVATQIICMVVDALIYLPFLLKVSTKFRSSNDLKRLFGDDAYSYLNEEISHTEERRFFSQQSDQLALMDSTQTVLQQLKGGEFMLYYQPKVDAQTQEVVGLEALLRYQDQDGGMHPPTFLPVLYQQGLSKSIDKKVVDLAIKQVLAWRDEGFEVPTVSINFDKDFLLDEALVSNFIARTDELGLTFTLEITEHTYTVDLKQLNQVIQRLQKSGHLISIDDFGAGYSSLTSLLAMSADEIKLDRKLVLAPYKDRKRGNILLESSVRLCHELGFKVVAEGIEDESQLRTAQRFGVDTIQGYLTGRPMSPLQVQHLFKLAPIVFHHQTKSSEKP